MSNDNKTWIKEFTGFVDAESVQPPLGLSENILKRVREDLNPSAWKVFSKISLIQALVGFAVLLFCPQFGFSLTGSHGIMHVLMQYGETVCMFGCGVIFAGSSLLASVIAMRPEEVQVLRKNKTLQLILLTLLTVGTFLCLGAEVFETLTLAWMAGSILGGITSLELGWVTRRWIRQKVIYG
ncbi:MAG: hypothetical protein SGI74_02520 [Oligoflexia bacterium]|nr:hypothetical protein [Oligoflexia bacterium]